MVKRPTIWDRNLDHGEDMEDRYLVIALADGEIDEQEREVLGLMRTNSTYLDEAKQVVKSAKSLIDGGYEAQANYFSEFNRRQRMMANAGMVVFPERRDEEDGPEAA